MTTVLTLIPGQKYNRLVVEMTKRLAGSYKSICYVTLNKTCRAMFALFDKYSINPEKFSFIDTITPTIFRKYQAEQCLFVESVSDLNNFAEQLLSVVREKRVDAVIFDSLSSLLVYQTDEEALNFLNYLTSFLERMGVNITIFCLAEDAARPAVKQLTMQADQNLTIGEEHG